MARAGKINKADKLKREMIELEKLLDRTTTKHHREQDKIRKRFDNKATEFQYEIGKDIEAKYGWKVGDTYYTGAFYEYKSKMIVVIMAKISQIYVDAQLYMDGKGDIYVQSRRQGGYDRKDKITDIFKTPAGAAASLLGYLAKLVDYARLSVDDAVKVEDFNRERESR